MPKAFFFAYDVFENTNFRDVIKDLISFILKWFFDIESFPKLIKYVKQLVVYIIF